MLRVFAPTLHAILDLIYPPRCAGCGDFAGAWWCASCDARACWLSPEQTARFAEIEGHEPLMVISAAHFEPPLREAIHALKYEGVPHVASALSAHMVHAWRTSSPPIAPTVLVPVPLHSRRERERGYNQSLLLANDVGRALALPVQPRALRRVRHTEKQAQLESDIAVRLANVRDAFAAEARIVRGQRVMLVDDVFTTGATLVACAAALRVAGAAEVIALTLARARK